MKNLGKRPALFKGRKKNADSSFLLLSSKIATMEFYFAL